MVGVNKISEFAFNNCSALTTIYVPTKKTDYYKKPLAEELHDKITERKPLEVNKGKEIRYSTISRLNKYTCNLFIAELAAGDFIQVIIKILEVMKSILI